MHPAYCSLVKHVWDWERRSFLHSRLARVQGSGLTTLFWFDNWHAAVQQSFTRVPSLLMHCTNPPT
jgi:hypothetical protein